MLSFHFALAGRKGTAKRSDAACLDQTGSFFDDCSINVGPGAILAGNVAERRGSGQSIFAILIRNSEFYINAHEFFVSIRRCPCY
jgi:hypothetical protein